VHPSPVRARVGLTAVAAMSFKVMLVSSHFFSIEVDDPAPLQARAEHWKEYTAATKALPN